MKKSLIIVAFATLFVASCQKEADLSSQNSSNQTPVFRASIEPLTLDTKAAINNSNQLEWATDDKIGIYFPSWGDKNQSFTLSGGEGTSIGTFTRDASGDYDPSDAAYAYFPWQGTAYGDNNIYEGTMYFKLKDWYDGYTTSGKMLTPLVASISSSEDIAFKHVGAAVKLTVNNLVSGGYKAKMTVYNTQITGDFKMDPANAGSEAIVLNGTENTDKNYITLNTWKGSGAFSWVFPVPTLSKPKLKFEITDENGVPAWSKSLKAQANDLDRGDILVMPAIDVTPYAKFVQDDACEWSFSGNINGSAWQDDIPMVSDGKYWILAGFTFKEGDEFRIRKDKKWDEAYPEGSGNNWVFTSSNAGAKDIIFNSETHEIKVVSHKFPYPEVDLSSMASTVTMDGDMGDWTYLSSLSSDYTDRIRSWKFTSDSNNLYFYFVLRKNRMSTAAPFKIAFDWDGSGALTVDDFTNVDAGVVFQPFTNASNGTPTCVDGTINDATINGSAVADAGIKAYGYDPNSGATGDTADYIIEVSIPRSKIPDLPASGNIKAGATYAWYETGLKDITL